MKIITVGDIHGRTYWKEIDPNKYDKIIFIADYTDQFPPMTDNEIQSNLLDIIELKKAYPDKVVLLLGNHDIQYMFLGEGFDCSGYRPSMAESLRMIFHHHKDLFQVAYQIEQTIWTHAGISEGWFDFNKKEIIEFQEKFDCVNLADTFNKMMHTSLKRILFQCGRKRGGSYPFGGIVWADRNETKDQYLDGYHQIVGHTPINIITHFGNEKGSIIYVDVLNEVYFEEQKKLEVEKKWGANTEYDKKIRELFPDLKPTEDKKEVSLLTKFYEFENESWIQ